MSGTVPLEAYERHAPPVEERNGRRPAAEVVHDQSLQAEERVLANLVRYYDDHQAVVATIDPAWFCGPGHLVVLAAVVELHRAGRHVDLVTVGDQVARDGTDLLTVVTRIGTVEVGARARILDDLTVVRNYAARRAALARHFDAVDAANAGRVEDAVALMDAAVTEYRAINAGAAPTQRIRPGGAALFDDTIDPDPVWGLGTEALWATGEPLLIAGPPGVGKTTLAGQVLAARLGLLDDVLGYPVTTTGSRVLYLALDRPAQIKRSLRRMLADTHRDLLDERLRIWEGPLPGSLADDPTLLVRLATDAGADTIVIDSLKDAAPKLTDDEVGGRVNIALQHAVSAGIEVVALHHQRKAVAGGAKPNALDDVYGSRWLTAGAGSVFMLWGSAGDPLVELLHLKQPAEPIGPLTLEHDHHAGVTTVHRGFDLRRYLALQPRGVTTRQVAVAMLDKADVTDTDRKRAERKLKAGIGAGWVHREDPEPGGPGGSTGARYYLVDTHREEP